MCMSHIIRKCIPLVLFLCFFIPSRESFAQITDSTTAKTEVFPNPFSSTITVQTNKVVETIEEISIYDAIGNLVYVFEESQWQEEEFTWNGQSNTGVAVPAGPYIFYIRTRDETQSILIQKI